MADEFYDQAKSEAPASVLAKIEPDSYDWAKWIGRYAAAHEMELRLRREASEALADGAPDGPQRAVALLERAISEPAVLRARPRPGTPEWRQSKARGDI